MFYLYEPQTLLQQINIWCYALFLGTSRKCMNTHCFLMIFKVCIFSEKKTVKLRWGLICSRPKKHVFLNICIHMLHTPTILNALAFPLLRSPQRSNTIQTLGKILRCYDHARLDYTAKTNGFLNDFHVSQKGVTNVFCF